MRGYAISSNALRRKAMSYGGGRSPRSSFFDLARVRLAVYWQSIEQRLNGAEIRVSPAACAA